MAKNDRQKMVWQKIIKKTSNVEDDHAKSD